MLRRVLRAYLGAVEFSLEVASEVILWPLAPAAAVQALCSNTSQTIGGEHEVHQATQAAHLHDVRCHLGRLRAHPGKIAR